MFRYGINLVESSEPDINHPICINSINEQGSLGSGNYGDVYLAKNQISNVSYAAKVLNKKTDDISDKELMNLCQEVIILSQLNHPSILKYKGHSPFDFEKSPNPVIFTEYASNGTLKDLIESEREEKKIISDTQKLIIIYGIASAISYLHMHDVLHKDLKLEYILIEDFTKSNSI